MNFVLARDKYDHFRFAALQSNAGQELLAKFDLSSSDFDTFILIDGENHFIKSTAALMIAGKLKSVVKIFYPIIYSAKTFQRFFL